MENTLTCVGFVTEEILGAFNIDPASMAEVNSGMMLTWELPKEGTVTIHLQRTADAPSTTRLTLLYPTGHEPSARVAGVYASIFSAERAVTPVSQISQMSEEVALMVAMIQRQKSTIH